MSVVLRNMSTVKLKSPTSRNSKPKIAANLESNIRNAANQFKKFKNTKKGKEVGVVIRPGFQGNMKKIATSSDTTTPSVASLQVAKKPPTTNTPGPATTATPPTTTNPATETQAKPLTVKQQIAKSVEKAKAAKAAATATVTAAAGGGTRNTNKKHHTNTKQKKSHKHKTNTNKNKNSKHINKYKSKKLKHKTRKYM